MADLSYSEKVKLYIKVAVVLGVITVVEVALTFLPHATQPMKTIVTMGIVALSCSKAFFVAYYYMHLNHEKRWTKIVAGIPVIMLVYTAALIADMPYRPESAYAVEAPRALVYPTTSIIEAQGGAHHGEAHEAAVGGPEAELEFEEKLGEWE